MSEGNVQGNMSRSQNVGRTASRTDAERERERGVRCHGCPAHPWWRWCCT